MTVRRDGQATRNPRAIVRRRRATVGEPRRMIVRRGGGGVEPPEPRGPRRQWQLPRGLTFALFGFAAGALVIAGVIFALTSSFFRVDRVAVAGTVRLSPDTIVEQADLLGENMFTADVSGAQERIYQLPLIASTRIERRWPSGIRIVVEERRTWGTWEQAGVRYAIDREGVVLGTMPTPPGTPVIRSSATSSLLQGERVNYQAVDAAAEIYDRLPRQLGTTVQEVAFTAGKGVQVTTADGQIALLGDSSAIAYKLATWAALETEARKKGIAYTTVDLRYGNRPVLQ